MDEIQTDGRLFLFAFLLAALTGLAAGLLPAWRAGRSDPSEALSAGARGSTAGRGSGRVRSLLVSLEVGLSAMCLIAGGLLLHSMIRLLNVDRGFASDRILTVGLSLPFSRYPDLQQREAFVRNMLDRLKTVPGVLSAAVSNQLPLGRGRRQQPHWRGKAPRYP